METVGDKSMPGRADRSKREKIKMGIQALGNQEKKVFGELRPSGHG